MIAFHRVELYSYIYIYCIYVVYVVMEVVSSQRAWSINGHGV